VKQVDERAPWGGRTLLAGRITAKIRA